VKSRIPSSILVSIYVALALSLVYLLIKYLGDSWGSNLVNEFLIFFFISFLVLVGVLEWLIYRRLKTMELLNQREIKKLKDLETYRRDFLGEVSHELKTPIFAVQGFIHTLMDGAIDDKKVRTKFLKKAMRNADRLSNLVEDLLIITQAESGEMEMKIRKFSALVLLQEVLETLDYKFTKKQRNISSQIITNGLDQVQVLADRERIQQVLTNLIDNAVKYGNADGRITIYLNEEAEKILVSVQDDGPGIEEEHLDKIFRRFYRVDKSRSRDKGGTGLGLAICKHLLEAHGESISVQSTVEQGTTFTFSLKRA
jgi:two-component system phosphate regulon sensor histidine kinase PhoR